MRIVSLRSNSIGHRQRPRHLALAAREFTTHKSSPKKPAGPAATLLTELCVTTEKLFVFVAEKGLSTLQLLRTTLIERIITTIDM